jgi:hypothetical protein
MKRTVRTLSELGEDVVLAPERFIALEAPGEGVALAELVVERRERATDPGALVLDTTHARDGILDIAAAQRADAPAKSAKKAVRAGDLVISRLRPYLRQIAIVHPRALASAGGRSLAVSTEFYVFAPKPESADLAFLLPYLLGMKAQAILAASQEGGHHPRVPRASVLALRIPQSVVDTRKKLARETSAALESLYSATMSYQRILGQA